MTDAEYDQLVERARRAIANMTPSALAHMHHRQRIEWGASAIQDRTLPWEQRMAIAARVAGPCPCDDCLAMRAQQSRPTQPLGAELCAALADACKEHDE